MINAQSSATFTLVSRPPFSRHSSDFSIITGNVAPAATTPTALKLKTQGKRGAALGSVTTKLAPLKGVDHHEPGCDATPLAVLALPHRQ